MRERKQYWIGESISGWTAFECRKAYRNWSPQGNEIHCVVLAPDERVFSREQVQEVWLKLSQKNRVITHGDFLDELFSEAKDETK